MVGLGLNEAREVSIVDSNGLDDTVICWMRLSPTIVVGLCVVQVI